MRFDHQQKTSPFLAVAAALCLILSACVQPGKAPTAGTAPAPSGTPAPAQQDQAVQPITGPARVALLVPLGSSDEQAARLGQALVNAARMAAGEAQAQDVDLAVYDTRGDAGTAGLMAERALSEGARLILGPLFSQSTRSVAQTAGPAGVRVISFSTDTSVAGDPVYVSGFLPEMEAQRILDFAGRRNLTAIGLYYPSTPYGEAARRGVSDAVRDRGLVLAAETAYPRSFQGIQETAPNFAAEAQSFGATAILLPDSGQGLRSVGAFMDFNGLSSSRVKYLGLGQWQNSATLQEPALRGGWFPAPDPSAVDSFADRYAIRYGARPPVLAVLGYDGVRVAAELMADAALAGVDPFSAEALTRPQGFQGAIGPLRFTPDGQTERGLAILEVGPGRFEVIEPAPRSFAIGS